MNLFGGYFSYERPDQMLQDLLYSKSRVNNHHKLISIHRSFDYIPEKAKKMPPSTNKKEFIKIFGIVNKILAFNEESLKGQGLKIITLNQMVNNYQFLQLN